MLVESITRRPSAVEEHYQAAQELLVGRGEVLLVPHGDPRITEHAHGLGELQDQAGLQEGEGLRGELAAHHRHARTGRLSRPGPGERTGHRGVGE